MRKNEGWGGGGGGRWSGREGEGQLKHACKRGEGRGEARRDWVRPPTLLSSLFDHLLHAGPGVFHRPNCVCFLSCSSLIRASASSRASRPPCSSLVSGGLWPRGPDCIVLRWRIETGRGGGWMRGGGGGWSFYVIISSLSCSCLCLWLSV